MSLRGRAWVGAFDPSRSRRFSSTERGADAVSFRAVERVILALRTDFGCLVIVIGFLIIMISTIVFANIITPGSSSPFL